MGSFSSRPLGRGPNCTDWIVGLVDPKVKFDGLDMSEIWASAGNRSTFCQWSGRRLVAVPLFACPIERYLMCTVNLRFL